MHSPLREDRKPSLVITDKGERILIHDFGGGRTSEVLGIASNATGFFRLLHEWADREAHQTRSPAEATRDR